MSPLRATLTAAGIVLVTLYCVAIQSLILIVAPSRWRIMPRHYFRMACRVAGIRVAVRGALDRSGPLLVVANHVSWMDIVAIGALGNLSFLAKKEVGDWPVFGYMSRLQRTILVDRGRRRATAAANAELAARLAAGETMVLFAEGTSSDGNQVLPFKSAIVGAVEEAARASGRGDINVQPLAIAYTRARGLPIGRQRRAQFAWYGDMDLLPHLWGVLGRGPIDAVISVGPVHRLSDFAGRKELTRALEAEVRRMYGETVSGRSAPAPGPAASPYAWPGA